MQRAATLAQMMSSCPSDWNWTRGVYIFSMTETEAVVCFGRQQLELLWRHHSQQKIYHFHYLTMDKGRGDIGKDNYFCTQQAAICSRLEAPPVLYPRTTHSTMITQNRQHKFITDRQMRHLNI